MERNKGLYEELKDLAVDSGAALFGAADARPVKKEFYFSDEILRDLDYALSIGVRLSDPVLDEIKDVPTKIYYHHYRQANIALDRIAFRITGFIQSKGYKALPVPASQIIDWEKQKGHLSHKKIGNLAGLGFIGRNNLLVNPKLGARFRLVSILTDIPLDTAKPLNNDCGNCRACIDACPAGAIKERAEDFDYIKCYEKLKEFRNKKIVDQFICGVCVKACRGEK
ncbi:MAG TPA: epoxyqueuosine reductase [Candidatus Omnitrophica bacterium]|nr:epoxyqueuosine reductase [Candidatus Omnitrophota bacterium]